jgi:hypothetical protein
MKNNIILIIIGIIFTLALIILLLGIFQFKWFDKYFENKNNYQVLTENLKLMNEKKEAEKNQTEETKEQTKETKTEVKTNEIKKTIKPELKEKSSLTPMTQDKNIKNKIYIYAKGSNLPNQTFDSLGEYVSNDDYNYRVTIIKSLNIKTVVINKLTPGNGISQEYFRVCYLAKMIPAKILTEVVESKEFRNLIPKKFLSDEVKTKGLKNGDSVKIPNDKIKDLLLLWTLGRLSPVQKAWKVKAVK